MIDNVTFQIQIERYFQLKKDLKQKIRDRKKQFEDKCKNMGYNMINAQKHQNLQFIMNNLHISYQEKAHTFGRNRVSEVEPNTQIAKPNHTLLYKYATGKHTDEQQQSLIIKKPMVSHGNSLNYSQLFNNIKISKNINQSRERQSHDHHEHESVGKMKNSQSQNHHQNIRKQIQFNHNFAYVPKSLPKIVKNKRHSHYIQAAPKYAINSTNFNDKHQHQSQQNCHAQEKRQIPNNQHQRTNKKSLSINHYDIFINDSKKSGVITTAMQRGHLKQENSSEHNNSNNNNNHNGSSLGQSFSSKLSEDEGRIKVTFQNELQKQIPELKQSIFQASHSKMMKKEDNYVFAQEISSHPHLLQIRDNANSQNNSCVVKHIQNECHSNFKRQPRSNKNHQEEDLLNLNYSKIQQNAKSSEQQNLQQKKHQKKDYKQQIQLFNRSFNHKPSTRKPIGQMGSAQNQIIRMVDRHHKEQKSIAGGEFKYNQQSQSQELILEMTRQNLKQPIIDRYSRQEQTHIHDNHPKLKHPSPSPPPLSPSPPNNHNNHNNNGQLGSTDNKSKYKRQLSFNQQKQSSEQMQIITQHDNTNNNLKKNEPSIMAKNSTQFDKKKNNNDNKIQIMQELQYKKFDIQTYIKVYEILKNIQSNLKLAQIDLHAVIKNIKNYLQIIAGGNLDNFQGYDIALNRLKIIKNALLYQRIAMIILSFAYATNKMKECLKYIINITIYATNNTLIILKILQSSEINVQNKNPVLAKSERLIVKRNFDTVRNNNDVILDSIFKISKNQEAFNQSFKEIIKAIGKTSIQQTFYNVLEYFAFFLCISNLYKNIPFLAVAPNPYLRESFEKKPTLVVDIVEVFCHGTKKSKSHVFRPHTQHFLNEMGQYYQIISFTCAYPNQIDKIIDILDTRKSIKHRLYRHHAVPKNNYLFKDTERIGRDLTKLILLDSDHNIQHEEVNNAIYIPNWKGNKSDTTLAELCPILAAIAIKNLDCKEATRKIYEQRLKNQHQGIKYINFGLNLE